MIATHDGKNRAPAPPLRLDGRGAVLVGLCVLTMVLLWAGGDSVRAALRFDRAAIIDGELWRLVTGHWVHWGFRHMALNAAGTIVIALLFTGTYSTGEWIVILLASTAAIDIGLLYGTPQLHWYVGASGVLHGALAAGAIAWWRVERGFLAVALAVVVVGKLTWEQLHGALPFVGDMPVIVDAHLYGALGGALTASVIELRRRLSSSDSRTRL